MPGRLRQEGPGFRVHRRRLDRTGDDLPPLAGLGQRGEVGADRLPCRLSHPGRQPVGNLGVGQLVEDRGVEAGQLLLVEARRGAAEIGKVEPLHQRLPRGDRLDRPGGAEPGKQRRQGLRLDPALAQGVAVQRAEALGQLAFRPDQQRLVREARRSGPQSGEHLHLHGGVADMVLAPQHVGDAHGDIVDHARQHVEPRAVGAAHHGIAELRGIEMLRAADAVLPRDRFAVIEAEAPVRGDALRRLLRPLRCRHGQRRAVIGRRQPAPQPHLALQLQLLLGFVAGVEAPVRHQPVECLLVQRQPLRLALLAVGHQPQPGEIVADRLHEALLAARGVGVVDPEQEAPAGLAGQQPVVKRGAQIADMQPAGGRGGETGRDHLPALAAPAPLAQPAGAGRWHGPPAPDPASGVASADPDGADSLFGGLVRSNLGADPQCPLNRMKGTLSVVRKSVASSVAPTSTDQFRLARSVAR